MVISSTPGFAGIVICAGQRGQWEIFRSPIALRIKRGDFHRNLHALPTAADEHSVERRNVAEIAAAFLATVVLNSVVAIPPQLAALAVTRAAATILAPTLAITVQTNQARLTIIGESNRTYTVLSSPDLLNWNTNASFISTNSVSLWSVPATNATRFFRVTAQ